MTTFFRTVECVANISAPLQGSIHDWPANIRDTLYQQLEAASARDGVKYHVVGSRADVDVDTGPYVHIVAAAEVAVQ